MLHLDELSKRITALGFQAETLTTEETEPETGAPYDYVYLRIYTSDEDSLIAIEPDGRIWIATAFCLSDEAMRVFAEIRAWIHADAEPTTAERIYGHRIIKVSDVLYPEQFWLNVTPRVPDHPDMAYLDFVEKDGKQDRRFGLGVNRAELQAALASDQPEPYVITEAEVDAGALALVDACVLPFRLDSTQNAITRDAVRSILTAANAARTGVKT